MSSTGGVKRQMQAPIVPQNVVSEDVAALSTIGMRIRKAVSDGYNVPSANGDGNANANGITNTASPYSYQNQFTAGSYIQRVPLPDHMNQPPALTNMGSTIDSSTSNLAEWDSRYQINNAPLQTLDQGVNYNKRKLECDDDTDNGSQPSEVANYSSKYGDLTFNEDF